MAVSIGLARSAIAAITGVVPAATLSRTTYAAAVVKLADGRRAVVIGTAGASASGIPPRISDAVVAACPDPAVIPVASPTPGQGTWHMNDAEQQILNVLATAGGALAGHQLKAIKATRNVCASCAHTLRTRGFVVNLDEAVAP